MNGGGSRLRSEAENPNNIAGSEFYIHVPQKGTQITNRVLLDGGKISDCVKVLLLIININIIIIIILCVAACMW